MNRAELLKRITVAPDVAGGKPCIRGTRICVSIILDGLAEGLTAGQLIDQYPQLTSDDIRAALLHARELAKQGDARWEEIIASTSTRPKLDAFLKESRQEGASAMSLDRL
jgi:uncharacterized protein (DUF433 family)